MTTLCSSPKSPPQVLPVLSRETTALLLESCARQTESVCDVFNITQWKSSSMLQTNSFEDTLRRSSNIIAWSLIVLFNYVKTIWMSQCDRLQPHLWHANTYLCGSTLCNAQQNILCTNTFSSWKQESITPQEHPSWLQGVRTTHWSWQPRVTPWATTSATTVQLCFWTCKAFEVQRTRVMPNGLYF